MKYPLVKTFFLIVLGMCLCGCAASVSNSLTNGNTAAPSNTAAPAPPETEELAATAPTSFVVGCSLPFESIKQKNLAIDKQCGIDGTAKANSAGALQNEKKNNFCATGTPVELSFSTFDDLQKQAAANHITFGEEKLLPTDRSVLANLVTVNGKKIGEGTVVTLTGTVFDSRHSNVSFFQENGESVNCKSGEPSMNDIHIELADPASPNDECTTVTAEISPHFRPASWDRFDVNPTTAPHVNGLTQLKGAKVKLTGQLFFDASHTPCVNGQGKAPVRRSIWEIHPVYAIDVFDTTKNKFVPLDTFAKGK